MARTVSIRLLADVAHFTRNVGGNAVGAVKSLSGELDRAAKAGRLDATANSAAGLGLSLAGMAGYAVKASMDFEKSMSAVKAATHAGAADVNRLREAALQAGKDTQYSATEAANGVTELAKAGVSTADILGGGLKGALDLAAAGQLDVGEAAETAASALTQFKLKGTDVPHVADLLAAAAGKAQGSVHDMGAALNQAGLVAAQTGLSIEEATGGLAAFASAGLTGSDAGTSFKQMLLMLQSPSDKTKGLMEELGISLYDNQGQFVGLAKFAGVLQEKLKNLTPEARAAAMAQIFGADATRAASIMYENGAAGVQKWIDKVNDAGYAQETAAMLTDNLAGDVERLKGSLETLAIEAGGGANGGLRILAQALNGLVDGFASLPSFISSTITVVAGLSGAALLLGAGWIKARRTTAEVRAELEQLGPAGDRAARGIRAVGAAAGKATAALAALQIIGAVIAHFQDDLKPNTEALAVGLDGFAKSGRLAGESSRILGDDMEKLQGKFAFLADGDNSRRAAVKNLQSALEGIVPGLQGTDESLARTQERITSIDAALAGMVSSGNTEDAAAAYAKLASVLAVNGVSMEEFKKQFPSYQAALETSGAASGDAAGATKTLSGALDDGKSAQEKYKTAADAATGAIEGQRDAFVALHDAMKAELDPVFGLLDAQDNLTEAQEKASKAIKKYGGDSKEADAANRDLAEAAVELEGKVGALSGTFNGKMTPQLKATLLAAGLTEGQIKNLAGQFVDARGKAEDFAGDYKAKASAPGATDAETKLKNAYTAANHFAGPYRADVSVKGYDDAIGKLNRLSVYQQALKSGKIPAGFNGPIKGPDGKYYAEGGWTGPGGKWDPAGVVHADEFVIKKDSRRSIEDQAPGLLDEMNATGRAPGYAGGGKVWPFPTTAAKTRIPSQAEVASKVTVNFGHWPSSPGAQRGDSGVWRRILTLVKGSGIPYDFGNAYRPGDPKWHGSGRAIDFMGYNQDRLAQFFMNRQSSVLELIHRTKNRDYGLTRGHYNAMPTQWPLHRNHLHIAMANGGQIREPVLGYGMRSGASYSFGERGVETVTPGAYATGGGTSITIHLANNGVIGSRDQVDDWLTGAVDRLRRRGRV